MEQGAQFANLAMAKEREVMFCLNLSAGLLGK